MDRHGLALEAIGPVHVATWVEGLVQTHETASVKQQLAGWGKAIKEAGIEPE